MLCYKTQVPIERYCYCMQGVPGAYSEMAAGRAYPNCEAVPCEQFEAAFKVIAETHYGEVI